MNINWSALIFVLLGQFIPFYVHDKTSAWIILFLVVIGLITHITLLSKIIIISKMYLIIVLSALITISVISLSFLKTNLFIVGILLMSSTTLIISGWVNFQSLLKVLSLFRYKNKTESKQLPFLEFMAIQGINFRTTMNDFNDSLRFSLTRKDESFFWFIAEAVVSFIVHLYRVGKQQNIVSKIKKFTFLQVLENNNYIGLNVLAWGVNLLLVAYFIIQIG